MISNITALGRADVPDDIGPFITAMCLEETLWVNGERIEFRADKYYKRRLILEQKLER